MAQFDELIFVLKELLTNRFAPKPEYVRGVLGDGLGNVVVPGKPDKSFVRFNRGSTEFFEIFNRTVTPVHDWPVLIGQLPWQPGLTQVVDTDWAAFEQSGWDDNIGSTSPHAPTHEWPDGNPGSDPVDVFLRSIVPLRAYTLGTGSTSIFVNSYEYDNTNCSGTVWTGLPGIDLSPVMTVGATPSGTARFMGIYLDPGSNVLGVVTGGTDVFTDAVTPPLVQFPAGVIPSARVRVYGGQTSIGEADIYDARRPFSYCVTGSTSGAVAGWPFSNVLTVDPSDTDADHSTIGAAITAASAGDIVLVGAGTYSESITISKALTIFAFDAEQTKITSTAAQTVNMTAANSRIIGFEIENTGTGSSQVGVRVAATNAYVKDCKITVSGAATTNAGVLHVSGSNVVIEDCLMTVSSATTCIGYYDNSASSKSATIIGGIITPNTYGIDNSANALSSLEVRDTIINQVNNLNSLAPPAGTYFDSRNALIRLGNTNIDTTLNKNLLYHSITHDIYQDTTNTGNYTDDTYIVGDVWNGLHNGPAAAPSSQRQDGSSTDPFDKYISLQANAASSQMGVVQFLEATDTKPLRGKRVSLSMDLWGTDVSNVRAAVLYFTGTADSLTSDVVGTWGTGNPTLAASWFYTSAPSASTAITGTRTRYNMAQNEPVPEDANNLAVFIWTPDNESNNDTLNIARVQLEQGVSCTEFIARPYSAELARVQRFFEAQQAGASFSFFGVGFVQNSTTALFSFLFTRKRTTPTISISAASDFRVETPSTTYTPSNLTFDQISTFSARGVATISGGSAEAALLEANNTTNAKVEIDARL